MTELLLNIRQRLTLPNKQASERVTKIVKPDSRQRRFVEKPIENTIP